MGIKLFPFSLFGFSFIDIIFGNEGPYISASRIPTLEPTDFKAKAKFIAKVDLPTPPLALDTAMVNFVPFIGFLVKFFGDVFPLKVSLNPPSFCPCAVS